MNLAYPCEDERYSAYDRYYGSEEEPEEAPPEPSVDSRVFSYSQTSTEVGNSRTRSFYSIDETSENTTQVSSWKQVGWPDMANFGHFPIFFLLFVKVAKSTNVFSNWKKLRNEKTCQIQVSNHSKLIYLRNRQKCEIAKICQIGSTQIGARVRCGQFGRLQH